MFKRVQVISHQAVIEYFRIVDTAVVEVGANFRTGKERYLRKGLKIKDDLYSTPGAYPLARYITP